MGSWGKQNFVAFELGSPLREQVELLQLMSISKMCLVYRLVIHLWVELHNIFSLAEVLHKTVSEILQMSVTEFNMWIAYFELKREEQDRQQRIAQMKRR